MWNLTVRFKCASKINHNFSYKMCSIDRWSWLALRCWIRLQTQAILQNSSRCCLLHPQNFIGFISVLHPTTLKFLFSSFEYLPRNNYCIYRRRHLDDKSNVILITVKLKVILIIMKFYLTFVFSHIIILRLCYNLIRGGDMVNL